MSLYVFDANEANKLTKDSIKKNDEQKLEQLLDSIQSRAINGYFSLTLWEQPLSVENKNFLKSNGYKIWETPGNCCIYEGQPMIITTISWE